MSNNIVLVLPSWYPSKLNKFDGDFVKRHIEAIALYHKQQVVFVIKDENGIVTKNVLIEENINNNFTEIIIYYKPFSTGIKAIDKLISQYKYVSLYKKAINNFIKANGRPTLTHLHIAYKAGILAKWIKKKLGINYLITENWTGYYKYATPNIYENNSIRNAITKNIFAQSKLFTPVTKSLGDYVNNNFIKTEYCVVPNVVNTNLFYYKNAAMDVFTFVHISTMAYQKNVDGILAACNILKNKGLNFKLNLIGNIVESQVQFAKENDLHNKYLFFTSAVPYEDVSLNLQNANALVMFSRFENLPCVILESLCCGTPVISTNVGGIAEVIDENNGILVSENIADLAYAMETMLLNYAKYNRQQISNIASMLFCYETVGKAYSTIYNEHFNL